MTGGSGVVFTLEERTEGREDGRVGVVLSEGEVSVSGVKFTSLSN